MECFKKIKIADSHIHTRFMNYENTVVMLEDMASVGVTDACILSLPYRGVAENLFALYVKMVYKKMQVRAFGGLHVTDRYAILPPQKQVENILSLGCDGIKLMFSPDLQRFYGKGLNDSYYDSMFQFLEEREIPVNIHLADPETFWDVGQEYADSSFPLKSQMYEEAFEMLDKHPRLRVCFAHFMFLSNFPEEAERVMEKYPNVWFDLTPGVEMYYNFDKQIERWQMFFEKYSHRILFGTDCNIVKKCNKELELLVYRKLTEKGAFSQYCYGKDFNVMGLHLTEETASRICYENYFAFLGREPKPVNVEKFCDCCRRIIDDLDKEPYDEYYVRGGTLIPDLLKDPKQSISYNFCKKALLDIAR